MTTLKKFQFVMPQYNCVWAVIKVAPHLWFILALVWIFVAVSAMLKFEVPSSGAVLVCGALISEIMFEGLHWRRRPGIGPQGYIQIIPDQYERAQLKGGDVYGPAWGGRMGALLSLAKDYEIKRSSDEYAKWFYRNTVWRVEKIILSGIIITAVAGTILWGYGHHLPPPYN
ncbi:MAG: hypothetical protein O3A78_01630 [Nitrospinae bacterium]|jgi:hypothetical protein|nr:hypothetical protein [Nitrospinota bacterium]MDA1108510.1 hypothetical protein [Nitrospinota bacterium]